MIKYRLFISLAAAAFGICVRFHPVKFTDKYAHFPMNDNKFNKLKDFLGMGEKNGEKPKIQITESVKIGIHSTVFSVGESPNLKPRAHQFTLLKEVHKTKA